VENIEEDIDKITEYEDTSGLRINPAKCEVFCSGFNDNEKEEIMGRIESKLPGIKQISINNFELLGSAVTPETAIHLMEDKTQKLSLLIKRLALAKSHMAFFILKNCMGYQKVLYLLRTATMFLHDQQLNNYDIIMQ
jgi:hypothetical protein